MRAALRKLVFLLLAASLTLHSGIAAFIAFHIYPLLVEAGLASGMVVAAIAVIGPAQVAGRLLVYVAARQLAVRQLGLLVAAGFPASLLILLLGREAVLPAVGAALAFGLANGIMTIVRGLVVPEMISRFDYGALNGALAAPALLARALAPAAGAALWTLTGSYDGVIVLAALGGLAMVVTFWAASRLSRRAPVYAGDGEAA